MIESIALSCYSSEDMIASTFGVVNFLPCPGLRFRGHRPSQKALGAAMGEETSLNPKTLKP